MQYNQLVCAIKYLSVHNVIREFFPCASTKGCQLHLGQAMWRKIQELGLLKIYSDLTGVDDSFVSDIKPDTPSETAACERYADCLLSTGNCPKYLRSIVEQGL